MFTRVEFLVHRKTRSTAFQLRADFNDPAASVQARHPLHDWQSVTSADGKLLTTAQIDSLDKLLELGHQLAPRVIGNGGYIWQEPDEINVTSVLIEQPPKAAMIALLHSHGDLATRGIPEVAAQHWLDEAFTAETAQPWLDIGMWCAETAHDCVSSGLTPAKVARVSAKLGSPIHMLCTGYLDLSVVQQWLD